MCRGGGPPFPLCRDIATVGAMALRPHPTPQPPWTCSAAQPPVHAQEGWYVPTDADWTILLITLDPTQAVNSGNVLSFTGAQSITAGTVMKSTVTNPSSGSGLGWNPGSPGTNTSGFSGLPGGFRTGGGIFGNIGNENYFYSATEYDINLAWYRLLYSGIGGVYRNYESKSFGASVRCLRD